LDFVNPISLTPQHNRYVLVMIKHFSKLLEVVPLPNYNNEGATYAFFDKMFSRFGAPAKVFTDQGTKFRGDFQDLCEQTLIDHWTASQDHSEQTSWPNKWCGQ
jgi:transposase-like protein